MKLVDIPFRLCEEVLDTALYFLDRGQADEILVYKSIGKTESYVKRAITILNQLGIVHVENQKIILAEIYQNVNTGEGYNVVREGLTNFRPLNQYWELLESGKSQTSAVKMVKAVHNITNDIESIGRLFKKYEAYLQIEGLPVENVSITTIASNSRIKTLSKKAPIELTFVSSKRIEDLRKSLNNRYDLSKLIKICEELNDAYKRGNYYSVGLLIRVMLDHIPPIFNKRSFSEIANNYGSKSFKDVMLNLENFNRKIADGFLHSHIKMKESLPNHMTVDCRNAIDVLLGEVISELR